MSGKMVKCPKCGKSFAAVPTLDGRSLDTHKSRPTADADPFPTLPAEFGRYRVLKLLGRGGMGAVYLAQDSQLGRKVALKIPFIDGKDAKRVERFAREGRSAAALHHPNICTVFDAGTIEGRPYLTMAYLAGKPLDEAIDPDAPMPPQRAAEIARKIATALAYAHENNVVHRDLKPANVMLTANGELVVMDFGLAKQAGDVDPNEVKLTRQGGLLGTPSYMAPEQVRGDIAAIGPATDIYALGAVLFEILVGRPPYTGPLAMVLGQILAAPVPPLREFRPDAPEWLEAACTRAMAKDPADRFGSMSEFADDLGHSLEETGVELLPTEPLPSAVIPRPVPAPDQPFDELKDTGPRAARMPSKRRAATPIWRRPAFLAAAIVLPLIAIAAAVVLRLETANGTLVVEIDDPAVEAKVKYGKLVLSGSDGKTLYTLEHGVRDKKIDAGSYKVRVEGADGLTLDTTEFTLKKGDKVTVRVRAEAVAAVQATTLAANNSGDGSVTSPPSDYPKPPPGGWLPLVPDASSKGKDGERWIELGGERLGLVPVPRGRGMIGSTAEDKQKIRGTVARPGGDGPYREVSIDYDLLLGRESVTVGQFRQFVKETSYVTDAETDGGVWGWDQVSKAWKADKQFTWRTPGFAQANDHPVVCVSWHDAKKFCEWAEASARKQYGPNCRVRLPDEEEWEYACRAGSRGLWFFGDEAENLKDYANAADLSFRTATGTKWGITADDGFAFTMPVGRKKANPWGLSDMHGNVWQWTESAYSGDSGNRVLRGGGWAAVPNSSRSAFRFTGGPRSAAVDTGFRVAMGDAAATKGGLDAVRALAGGENLKGNSPGAPNPAPIPQTDGFQPLFNGKDLTGWTPNTEWPGTWTVKDGVLTGLPTVRPNQNARGFLRTARNDYADFHFKATARMSRDLGWGSVYFRVGERGEVETAEDRWSDGWQVAIRAQKLVGEAGDPTWTGGLMCGNYVLSPPRPRSTMKAGEWFDLEVIAVGWEITVKVNGAVVNRYTDLGSRPHRNSRGFISLYVSSQDCPIEFRKVEIKELQPGDTSPPTSPAFQPPPAPAADGFVPLFNGKDLSGWVVDGSTKATWTVADGVIVGQSPIFRERNYLLSDRDYTDYILRFDFQVTRARGTDGADSHGGVTVRATPGEKLPLADGRFVFDHPMIKLTHPSREEAEGNGKSHWLRNSAPGTPPSRRPAVTPDTWHAVEVVVRGDRCIAAFDGQVATDVSLDRDAAIVEGVTPGLKRTAGRVGFQINTGLMRYRNVRIKELAAEIPTKVEGFVPLFNGKDLTGWVVEHGDPSTWIVKDGHIVGKPSAKDGSNFLLSKRDFSDFELRLEFNIEVGCIGAVVFRAIQDETKPVDKGPRIFAHPMIQLVETSKDGVFGRSYWVDSDRNKPTRSELIQNAKIGPGEWHRMLIAVRGSECKVRVNDVLIQDIKYMPLPNPDATFLPGLARKAGKVGLRANNGKFRAIDIRELEKP